MRCVSSGGSVWANSRKDGVVSSMHIRWSSKHTGNSNTVCLCWAAIPLPLLCPMHLRVSFSLYSLPTSSIKAETCTTFFSLCSRFPMNNPLGNVPAFAKEVFLSLSNIELCIGITFTLSAQQLMGICIVCTSWRVKDAVMSLGLRMSLKHNYVISFGYMPNTGIVVSRSSS